MILPNKPMWLWNTLKVRDGGVAFGILTFTFLGSCHTRGHFTDLVVFPDDRRQTALTKLGALLFCHAAYVRVRQRAPILASASREPVVARGGKLSL